MPNARLVPYRHASAFRHIAAVAWRDPADPTILGSLLVRAAPLEAWIARKRQETGERITVTHAVARAVALALHRHPDLNACVRWGRLWLREHVDVFLQVAIPPGEESDALGRMDLSGLCIRRADRKDVVTIAREVAHGAARIRAREDPDFERQKRQASWVPPWLFRWVLRLLRFLQVGLNLDTRWLGAPRDPFGSAMVTSLGMHGVELAWAPFFPLASCPLIVLVGAVSDLPVVEDGAVVPRRMLRLNATMDHRVIDGVQAAVLARAIVELLEEPERLDAPDGEPPGYQPSTAATRRSPSRS